MWNQNEKILAPRFSKHRNGKFTSLNRLEAAALFLS
ncbi:hypothetical protein NLB62_04930 [Porphyromonas gingivalis]|nr:hypothetical protein [Porphyromonas gingivalis]MDP0624785.1 hypothetical protein [Porphyromonas gingivalis]WKD52741.1 hypothetical protein NF669_00045 [Porphyromonas gingivalis]WKD54790.1 hypothetical protein NF668_00045 [Porphyromonas gingivalis]